MRGSPAPFAAGGSYAGNPHAIRPVSIEQVFESSRVSKRGQAVRTTPAYGGRMDLSDISEAALALDGVRESTQDGRPRWTYRGRLVARAEDRTTLVVRVDFEERELFVAEHPETFAVTPPMERHMKMQVVLDHGNDDAVRRALTAAWELQRSV